MNYDLMVKFRLKINLKKVLSENKFEISCAKNKRLLTNGIKMKSLEQRQIRIVVTNTCWPIQKIDYRSNEKTFKIRII